MANELNIQLDPFNQTGLVLLGKVFDKDGTQQGSSVTLTENAPALYSGDFSLASISDDAYLVRFETNLPDELYGTGALYVRNNAEVSQENFFNATLDEVVTDTASRDASKADVSSIETKAEADARQVVLISENDQTQTDISNLNDISASDVYSEFISGTNEDAFKADVSGLSTFNPANDDVNTNVASRDASKADLSAIETKAQADIRQSAIITENNQTQVDISNLNNISTTDVQGALTSQGYTVSRSANLDNLDTTVSSRNSDSSATTRQTELINEHNATQSDISNLNNISSTDVQNALTTQGYTTTRSNSLDNLDATVSSRATQTSVDNLQNNSSFQATIPPQIQRPETGTETFDLFVRLFDSSGVPTDPSSSNAMTIKVVAQDGTVLTNTTAMTRTGVGAFEYEATLNSTTALGQYNVFFDYDINDTAIEQVRTLQYVESVATIDQVQTTVDNIETIIGVPTNGTIALDIASRESEASASARETTNSAEHVTTQNAIGGLNDFDPATEDVNTNAISRNASKADVSGLSTFDASTDTVTTDTVSRNASKADVSGLSTFDFVNDDVNTNNLSRAASKADVSNLATQSSVDDIPDDVDTKLTVVHGSGSWQQGSSSGTVDANIVSVDGNNVNGVNDFKADVSGLSTFDASNDDVNTNTASRNASKADVSNLSTFDPSSDDVTTDVASREASKADVTDLATKDNQEVINDGVKKASLLIPHSDNLPD